MANWEIVEPKDDEYQWEIVSPESDIKKDKWEVVPPNTPEVPSVSAPIPFAANPNAGMSVLGVPSVSQPVDEWGRPSELNLPPGVQPSLMQNEPAPVSGETYPLGVGETTSSREESDILAQYHGMPTSEQISQPGDDPIGDVLPYALSYALGPVGGKIATMGTDYVIDKTLGMTFNAIDETLGDNVIAGRIAKGISTATAIIVNNRFDKFHSAAVMDEVIDAAIKKHGVQNVDDALKAINKSKKAVERIEKNADEILTFGDDVPDMTKDEFKRRSKQAREAAPEPESFTPEGAAVHKTDEGDVFVPKDSEDVVEDVIPTEPERIVPDVREDIPGAGPAKQTEDIPVGMMDEDEYVNQAYVSHLKREEDAGRLAAGNELPFNEDVARAEYKAKIAEKDAIDRFGGEPVATKPNTPAEGEGASLVTEAVGDEGSDLNKSINDLAKQGDEYYDPNTPRVAAGMSVEDIGSKKVREPMVIPEGTNPQGINPEVNARWESARNRATVPLRQRVSEKVKEFGYHMSRTFPSLSPKKYGGAIDELRKFLGYGEYSREYAKHSIRNVVRSLDDESIKVFERNIILPDMVRMVKENPNEYLSEDGLWFGYRNLAEMESDLDNFKRIAAANPRIAEAIEKRNGFMNELQQQAIEWGVLNEDVAKAEDYFHRQVLNYMQENIPAGTTGSKFKSATKGSQRARKVGDIKDFNTRYTEAEGEVITQLVQSIKEKQSLAKMKKMHNKSSAVRAAAKAAGVENADTVNLEKAKQFLPEDHVIWSPDTSPSFVKVKAVDEVKLVKLLEAEVDKTNILADKNFREYQLRTNPEQWVIPKELAETLDNLKPPGKRDGIIARANKGVLKAWKAWKLTNPWSVVKYNLNNTSGDVDIVFAYDPTILKGTGRAASDLWQEGFKKGTFNDYLDAVERSVIGSGLTAEELPAALDDEVFRLIQGTSKNPAKAIKKYFYDSPQKLTNFRENILRLSSYRHFKDKIRGLNGKTIYAASEPEAIKQMWANAEQLQGQARVDAINDIAAKLSRDLVGDYGAISPGGRWIRERLIPFYSWMEINAPRYYRLLKNSGKEGAVLGRTAKVGLKKAATSGLVTAGKAAGLMTAVQVWNELMFPEESKIMREAHRDKQFLILGRRENGSPIALKFQGALSDAVDLFAMSGVAGDIAAAARGEVSMDDFVEGVKGYPTKMAANLLNKVGTSMLPIQRMMGEVSAGVSVYPKIFDDDMSFSGGRKIRDRAAHVARTMSVDALYTHIVDMTNRAGITNVAAAPPRNPMTSAGAIAENVANLLIYQVDPAQSAYYISRGLARDYAKKQGYLAEKEARADALWMYKELMKNGDKTEAKKWLNEYKKLGGSKKGYAASKKAADPMAILPKDMRKGFWKSLTPDQKRIVELGKEYHGEWY